jgi:hypothetical protein
VTHVAILPRREYLEKADQVLDAGGLVAAAWEDVKKVRYAKKAQDLAKLESQAVELSSYVPFGLHGLLQTETFARALMGTRRPALAEDDGTGPWPRGWHARPSSSGLPHPNSALSWKRWV